MSQARVRPSQVTIVVILIWIAFALTVVGAIATILAGTAIAASDQASVEQLLKDLDLPTSWSSTAGPIVIVTGALFFIVALIEAIFAVAIGRGSNVARILLIISAAMTALISLLAILSAVSVVTLRSPWVKRVVEALAAVLLASRLAS